MPVIILFDEYFKHSKLSKSWARVKLTAPFNDHLQILFRADYQYARAFSFIDETSYKTIFNRGGKRFVSWLKKTHAEWTELKLLYLKRIEKQSYGPRMLKRLSLSDVISEDPDLFKTSIR